MKNPTRKPVGKREAAAIATLFVAGMAAHADTSEAFLESGLSEDEQDLVGQEILALGERMSPGVPMSVFSSTKSVVEHVLTTSVRNAMAVRKPRKTTPAKTTNATPEQVVAYMVEAAGADLTQKLAEDFVTVLAKLWDNVENLPVHQITMITLGAVNVAIRAGSEAQARLMRGNRVSELQGGLFNGGYQKLIDEAISLRDKTRESR
jgi:hypothetical protein